jgi:hypothetical protein
MVIGISGRVDGYNYAEFREQVNQLIDAGITCSSSISSTVCTAIMWASVSS